MNKSDFIFSLPQLVKYLHTKGIKLSKNDTLLTDRPKNHFFLLVPKYYIDLIDWDHPDDPLRKMVITSNLENEVKDYELTDPIGDQPHSPVPGIIHRYPDRCLLNLINICAIHCRFCFRRNLLASATGNFAKSMEYIASHPEIWEVILSGGDPFMYTDDFLEKILNRLKAIPHVKIIRFHTRIPAVYPTRITGNFLHILKGGNIPKKLIQNNEWVTRASYPSLRSGQAPNNKRFILRSEATKGRTLRDSTHTKDSRLIIVLHINHPREITKHFRQVVEKMKNAGIMLLSQTVLMKGVNNDAVTLAKLFKGLIEIGVKPYYLHHLDLAAGTDHFRISVEEGKSIMRQLRGHISGHCIPEYVIDTPGGFGKIPVFWFERINEKTYKAESFEGKQINYIDYFDSQEQDTIDGRKSRCFTVGKSKSNLSGRTCY